MVFASWVLISPVSSHSISLCAYLFFEVKKVIPNAQRSHFVGSGRGDW